MGERNPNYVTPEEAASKDCIFNPSKNYCTGPKCMAWHWHEYQIPVLGNESHVVWQKETSKTYGRCGMVPMMPTLGGVPE